jgi:hypothetical protein
MNNIKEMEEFFDELNEERLLGRGMSPEALQRDTDQSDREYIQQRQKRDEAKQAAREQEWDTLWKTYQDEGKKNKRIGVNAAANFYGWLKDNYEAPARRK